MNSLTDSKQRRNKGLTGYGEFLMQKSFRLILEYIQHKNIIKLQSQSQSQSKSYIQYHYFEIHTGHIFDKWMEAVINRPKFITQISGIPLHIDYFFFDEFTWIDRNLNIRPLMLCGIKYRKYNCEYMMKRTYIFDYFGHFTWYAQPFHNWSYQLHQYLTPSHFLKAVRTLDNTKENFLGYTIPYQMNVEQEIEQEIKLLSEQQQQQQSLLIDLNQTKKSISDDHYGLIYGHAVGLFEDYTVRKMLVEVAGYLLVNYPQIRLKSILDLKSANPIKSLLPMVEFIGFKSNRQEWLSLLQNADFLLGVGAPCLGPNVYEILRFGGVFINIKYSSDDKNNRCMKMFNSNSSIIQTQHDDIIHYGFDPTFMKESNITINDYICTAKLDEYDKISQCILNATIKRQKKKQGYVPYYMTWHALERRVQNIFADTFLLSGDNTQDLALSFSSPSSSAVENWVMNIKNDKDLSRKKREYKYSEPF